MARTLPSVLSPEEPGRLDLWWRDDAPFVTGPGHGAPGLVASTSHLLSVADHCLRSRHYVNVIVDGKQPALDCLPVDEAIAHCTRGLGIWDWASSDGGGEPDVVLACAGDIPTVEAVSAAALLREPGDDPADVRDWTWR